MAADIALNGNIDSVDPSGMVSGWCWSPNEPAIRRLIRIAIDGANVAEFVADAPRPDLANAGVGDGGHGFSVQLAPGDIPDQPQSVLTLHDVATGRRIGSELTFAWTRAAPGPRPLAGNLERASEDGWISGWAWDPADPARRLTLDVVIDGEIVGVARAADFRSDLLAQSVGDGRYGFSFALPWAVMTRKGEMLLAIRDPLTGQDFGDPLTVRIGRLVEVEERMHGLERQVRQLEARLAEQDAAADATRQALATRALFTTVAAFFHDLAEAPDPAHPSGTALRHAVGAVLDGHAPLTLAVPDHPSATLLLLGEGPLASIHAGLSALREGEIDRLADIVLLDDPRFGADIALLPAIVRNLRYARRALGGDVAVVCNEIVEGARAATLIVMSSRARPAPGAIAELLDGLATRPELGFASGSVARPDELPDQDESPPLFFAVSRWAFGKVGGFPLGDDDLARSAARLHEKLGALSQAPPLQARERGRRETR